MVSFNVFRILGDLSHMLSKCILMWAIHRNKSAEGVSLITQGLYTIVFCARYLDIFWTPPPGPNSYPKWIWAWNFGFKIFYTVSSFYILLLMMRVYARTREREQAWKMGAYCLGGALIAAPILTIMPFLREEGRRGPSEMLIVFSLILESTCILPQLLLLRQTTVPTVIDSFYLVALGSYRFFYILNWIEREFDDFWKPDPISVTFGIVQTALYIDFAWVYYSRQRVKLRSGGIVDAEDLNRGWLLNKIFGRTALRHDDEEGRPALEDENDDERPKRGKVSNWGARGISVQADDAVLSNERRRQQAAEEEPLDAPDAQMRDPDELARIFDEDDDSDDDGVLRGRTGSTGKAGGIGNGTEWREGV